MSDSYGSHVLTALKRFIDTHNSYVAEHDAKLKILEQRLNALEAAQQAPAQVPAATCEQCELKAENAALREENRKLRAEESRHRLSLANIAGYVHQPADAWVRMEKIKLIIDTWQAWSE